MTRRKPPAVPPPLHELEAEVMQEVWSAGGDVTPREILEALNARSTRQRAYTTVLTIITRLHDKQLLRRRQVGKTHVYAATLDEQTYRDARAGAVVSALVEEFGDVALAHFAREVEGLDAERLEQLRRLTRES